MLLGGVHSLQVSISMVAIFMTLIVNNTSVAAKGMVSVFEQCPFDLVSQYDLLYYLDLRRIISQKEKNRQVTWFCTITSGSNSIPM